MKKITLTTLIITLIISGYAGHTTPTIQLTSKDFIHEQLLPAIFTADENNISPHLAWKRISRSTKSIVILCDSYDTPKGIWSHWVIFNIPPSTTELKRNIAASATFSNDIRQGKNSFGSVGYNGACPPKGYSICRYFFKIFALNTKLNLPANKATRRDVLLAMKKHVLAKGIIMGIYLRTQ